MAATTWQVRIGQNLSKQYTIDQLKSKLRSGFVEPTAACTFDNGESFVQLSDVLAGHQHDNAELDTNVGQRKTRRLSKTRSTGFESIIDNQKPSFTLNPVLESSQFRPPSGKPESLKVADAVLTSLYSNASTAVPESGELELEDQIETEVYRIPATPPSPARAAEQSPPIAQSVDPRQPVERRAFAEPRQFIEPQPSPIALAAARALEQDQKKREAEQAAQQARQRPAKDRTAASESDWSSDDNAEDKSGSSSFVKKALIAFTVIGGIGAASLMGMWYGSNNGPPTFRELTGGALELSDFKVDGPVTIDELNARTQILGVQVGRITRALTLQEGNETPVELPELPQTPKMPLVPFQQNILSSELQAKNEDYRNRYAQLIKDKGPDGRKIDEATIARTIGYLNNIIAVSNSNGPDRTSALFELSEWVKLLYLLELGRLSDGDVAKRQLAINELLTASNTGMAACYSELLTGDMRFVDVVERSDSPEQARLLLTRYWYHRAVNRTAADQWLQETLKLVDASEHSFVRNSIDEVNQIEQ